MPPDDRSHQDSGQDENWIFIHSRLDEYGLTPQQFRVLAHVSRRGNCYASMDTIAKFCRLHSDTVDTCLKFLAGKNIIRKERRPGFTSIYIVNSTSGWDKPDWIPPRNEGLTESEGEPSKSVNSSPKRRVNTSTKARVNHPPETKGDKGNPSESNPIEGNPKKEIPDRALCLEILSYLSLKSGTKFREIDQHLLPISQRLASPGVEEDGIKKMIDRQCTLWKPEPKMAPHLRPETLFGEKFDGYYDQRNTPIPIKNGADERRRYDGPSRAEMIAKHGRRTDGSAGTANEGTSHLYAGIGKVKPKNPTNETESKS